MIIHLKENISAQEAQQLAEKIKAFYIQSEGKSVLITSYMHTALDNVLLKLKERKVDFLRLGAADKVSPDLQEYLVDSKIKTVRELETYYSTKLVVATTCLSLKRYIFIC